MTPSQRPENFLRLGEKGEGNTAGRHREGGLGMVCAQGRNLRSP